MRLCDISEKKKSYVIIKYHHKTISLDLLINKKDKKPMASDVLFVEKFILNGKEIKIDFSNTHPKAYLYYCPFLKQYKWEVEIVNAENGYILREKSQAEVVHKEKTKPATKEKVKEQDRIEDKSEKVEENANTAEAEKEDVSISASECVVNENEIDVKSKKSSVSPPVVVIAIMVIIIIALIISIFNQITIKSANNPSIVNIEDSGVATGISESENFTTQDPFAQSRLYIKISEDK